MKQRILKKNATPPLHTHIHTKTTINNQENDTPLMKQAKKQHEAPSNIHKTLQMSAANF